MALFRCHCNTFSIKKNNYRKKYVHYLQQYGKAVLPNIKKKLCILIFEGGGLQDEYAIVKTLIAANTQNVPIDIYLIDIEINKKLKMAREYFQKKIIRKTIKIFCIESISFITFPFLDYDTCIAFSLDPYYFLIDQFLKSPITDIIHIAHQCTFCCISILYATKSNILWQTTLSNKINKQNSINKQTFYGQNEQWRQSKQERYYHQ